MKRNLTARFVGIAALFTVFAGHAVVVVTTLAQESLRSATISVDGAEREYLSYAPPSAKEKPTPVVFVFHGHGGSMHNAARSFAIHRHWPEAIAIYMQGVPTAGRLTDPEGRKAGWQSRPDDFGGRDLNFFDAVLEQLKTDYRVDGKRIYCTGHSNGGGFTYLLWAVRNDVFAAVAPSSAASARSAAKRARLKPKPAMHIAGEADSLVKYEWQVAAMDAVRELNGCAAEGRPWFEYPGCLIYESTTDTPFVSVIHPGGHKFYSAAPALIVQFFQEH